MAHRISISIAGHEYKFDISTPEEEEIYRKAADDVNRIFRVYRQKYPAKRDDEILSLVAFSESINYMNKLREQEACELEIAKMHRDMEGYLENIDKNSR